MSPALVARTREGVPFQELRTLIQIVDIDDC
jgi:hypothetical protein